MDAYAFGVFYFRSYSMQVISKYIFKNVARTQFAIFTVLMFIFMSQTFIKFISRAASGRIPTELVTQLLSLSIPSMAGFMLPLSVFLAVLFAVGSMCSQSEMVVMRSVGYSRSKLLKICFGISLVTAVMCALCSLWLAPWCEAKQLELISKSKSDPTFFAIDTGRFLKFRDLIIYVEDVAKLKDSTKAPNYKLSDANKAETMKQVYLLTQGNKNLLPSVNVSNEGWIENDKENLMWVNLKNGYMYIGPDENGEFQISSYEHFKAYIPGSKEDDSKTKISSKPTVHLLSDRDVVSLTEFEWRLVQPFGVIVLVMLVVPLSMVNPRQGRFAKFVPAVAIYISYFLLVFGIKSACARGIFPLIPGVFIVPILYAFIFAIPFNLTDTEMFNKMRATRNLQRQSKGV